MRLNLLCDHSAESFQPRGSQKLNLEIPIFIEFQVSFLCIFDLFGVFLCRLQFSVICFCILLLIHVVYVLFVHFGFVTHLELQLPFCGFVLCVWLFGFVVALIFEPLLSLAAFGLREMPTVVA